MINDTGKHLSGKRIIHLQEQETTEGYLPQKKKKQQKVIFPSQSPENSAALLSLSSQIQQFHTAFTDLIMLPGWHPKFLHYIGHQSNNWDRQDDDTYN